MPPLLILGLIFIVVGALVPKLVVLFTIGVILVVVALVLLALGHAGRFSGWRR